MEEVHFSEVVSSVTILLLLLYRLKDLVSGIAMSGPSFAAKKEARKPVVRKKTFWTLLVLIVPWKVTIQSLQELDPGLITIWLGWDRELREEFSTHLWLLLSDSQRCQGKSIAWDLWKPWFSPSIELILLKQVDILCNITQFVSSILARRDYRG